MNAVNINVWDYYGVPALLSVMPLSVFCSLESAALEGLNVAVVSRESYDSMMSAFRIKMDAI